MAQRLQVRAPDGRVYDVVPGRPTPQGVGRAGMYTEQPGAGPRGRGDGEVGALGVGTFGEAQDLDRVSRGKMIRVQSPTVAIPLRPAAQVPIDGAPLGVMQVTQVSPNKIQLLTIQIDRERITEAPNCELRCRIRWGVGGARDFLFCDWSDGGLISLVADELWVDAIPYAPSEQFGPFDPTGFERLISACVGEGGNDAIPPQFTAPLVMLLPGAATSVPVPAYARAVSVVAMNTGFGAGTVLSDPYPDLVMRLFAGTTQLATFVGPTVAGGAAVPIARAGAVTINNTSATERISVSPVFHLGV